VTPLVQEPYPPKYAAAVLAAVTEEWETAATINARIGISRRLLIDTLWALVAEQRVEQMVMRNNTWYLWRKR